jgi:hemoglobin-like flavoprotein
MSMTDDQIAQVFGSLGRIEQKIDSSTIALKEHAEHDTLVQKELFVRVEALQLSHANQKGAAKAWGMVYGALGAILGAVASYWGGTRH